MNLKKMIMPAASAALAITLAFGTAGAASAQDRHQQSRGRSASHSRFEHARPAAHPAIRRDSRAFDRRVEPRGSVNRGFVNRGFVNRGFVNRGFVNRGFRGPVAHERFVAPRVIYPRLYRPGFRLGFGVFFGPSLPYRYVYPGYSYGTVAPSGAYGAISFALNPADAAVYVDGNYAGESGAFSTGQPLPLAAGAHRIELDAQGCEPVAFDVNIVPGQVIPYQGTLQPAQ